MIRIIAIIFISFLCACQTSNFVQSDEIELSRPAIAISDVFFSEKTSIKLINQAASSQTHFTFNGSNPTVKDDVLSNKLNLSQSGVYKFKTFEEGFIPSEVVETEVIHLPKNKPNGIVAARNPDAPYDKSEVEVLIDHEKGSLNFHEAKWLGYNGGNLSFTIGTEQKEINQLILSFLIDEKSWIFAPSSVKVFYHEKLISTVELEASSEMGNPKFDFIHLPLKITDLNGPLEIRIEQLEKIPIWHPGAGSAPWLFIDEIILE